MEITETARTVLEKRYFVEGEYYFKDLVNRVSTHFGNNEEEINKFSNLMLNGNFLPNSPALMNAGTDINSFSACFVLPIEDNIESIYKFYSDAAKISKSGGGVGACYSNIRAKNSKVQSTNGVASGPISFMEVQNKSTDIIKQGGRRRGANMAVLDCYHNDINDFVKCKDEPGVLENFNLSIRISDAFMDKALNDNDCEENKLWNELCQRAWSSAEPGVLFGDTIERGNLTKHLGKITATNPSTN